MKSISIFAISIATTCGFIYWSYVALQDYCSDQSIHSSPDQTEQRHDREGNSDRQQPDILVSEAHADTANNAGENNKKRWKREFFCDLKGSGFALSWATLFLVLVTGGLIWIGANQAQSTRAIERAYIFAVVRLNSDVVHDSSPQGLPNKVIVNLQNSGKTAAILSRLRLMPFYLPAYKYPDKLPGNGGRELPQGLVVAPGEEFDVPTEFNMIDKNWDEIERTNISFGFCGKIEYKDIFQNSHETSFCWHYSPHQTHRKLMISPSPLNKYT